MQCLYIFTIINLEYCDTYHETGVIESISEHCYKDIKQCENDAKKIIKDCYKGWEVEYDIIALPIK